jgi:hypothetical protein
MYLEKQTLNYLDLHWSQVLNMKRCDIIHVSFSAVEQHGDKSCNNTWSGNKIPRLEGKKIKKPFHFHSKQSLFTWTHFFNRLRSFWKHSPKSSKRNSVEFGRQVFLNIFNILQPFTLREVSTLGKRKNRSRNWDCLDKSGRSLVMM